MKGLDLFSIGGNNCYQCRFNKNKTNNVVLGNGKKKIMLIFDSPDKSSPNTYINNKALNSLENKLYKLGIDLYNDCFLVNAINCKTDGKIQIKEIKYCRNNVLKIIKDTRPNKIITLGPISLLSILDIDDFEKYVGYVIPLLDFNAWLCCNYELNYALLTKDEVMFNLFDKYLEKFILLDKPLPKIIDNVKILYDVKDINNVLVELNNKNSLIAVDFETTGKKPHKGDHHIICVSICDGVVSYVFEMNDFIKDNLIALFENDKVGKIGHNSKYEMVWAKKILNCDIKNWVWDTMIAAHSIDNRNGISGLKFQTFVNFGIKGYDDGLKKFMMPGDDSFNTLNKVSIYDLMKYCGLDSLYTFELYKQQINSVREFQKKGIYFFMDGQKVFSIIENNGLRINKDYFDTIDNVIDNKMKEISKEILTSDEVKNWPTNNFNFNSTQQLSRLLFDILKYKSKSKTAKGNYSVSSDVLEELNTSFTKKILEYKKYDKIKNTYISNIKKEVVGEYIYPNFNLNMVVSFRSSSDSPNFHSMPKRDKEAQKIIRTGFIVRDNHVLMEIDYSAIEVRISACYHKDKEMIKYINDSKSDMHRDIAKLIFMKDDITKEERYIAKNSFVFPQFYGDYYKNCASVIWKTANDDLLKKFKNYQQFENHVKDIEYEFWNRKFVEYNEWKTDIWNFYLKKGFVKLYTGFICTGYMNKKQVTNYPIQGSAFHCLLWSLIELQKFITENKLNSLIVGQIHDSMIVDVDVNELEELSNVIYTIMTKKIREYWDWIIVPLDVEMKVSNAGGNWFDMKEFKIIKK